MKLSVIGLGKLGACTAACFAAKAHEVIGVDIVVENVNAINRGMPPIYEPRLQELITQGRAHLSATLDFSEALHRSDISFLIVPTPSRPDGHFSDHYLRDALIPLAQALKHKQSFHTFVITATVSPGTTQAVLLPLIEEYSGKKLNVDFGMAYNPEFIALGSVIDDFLHPDMVLIGESSHYVGQQLEKLYLSVCETQPYMAHMSINSAEIAKISLNTYVTMKISFANTLSNVCAKMPDTNVDDITRALGADKRIAPSYLKGGLGFGGPCFPRDNRAFAAFAAEYGVDAWLAKATDTINDQQNQILCQWVRAICAQRKISNIGILGLSYKPYTPVIEESPAIKLIQALLKNNVTITVYDPLAIENTKALFGEQIRYAISIKDCLEQAAIGIIMTADRAWSNMSQEDITHDPTLLLDCWRVLDQQTFDTRVQILRLGECENKTTQLELPLFKHENILE